MMKKSPGPASLSEPAEAQDDDPLPLIGDLDRIGEDRGDDEARDRDQAAGDQSARGPARIGDSEPQPEEDYED